ncbi:MAG TPA: peptidoglycan editing factor PgeF [Acidimicrobiales bacterium]|nr:peptidoglycan editing factor PgeF [Acidimicrobiales bacterium]
MAADEPAVSDEGPPAGHAVALRFGVLDGMPLDHAVTGRGGGVSSGAYASLNLGLTVGDDPALVAENRRRAAAAVGCRLDEMVFAHQVHGATVAVVTGADRGRGAQALHGAPSADALVTAVPDVGLAVVVADCLPLVLYDPVAHVVAVVHAGWRGTVARVAEATVDAMAGLGSRPGDVVAGLGPAVAAHRYQVGGEVVDAAAACFDGRPGDVVRPDGTGRWTFDLTAANRRLLVEAGVAPANIEASPVGTGPGTAFFSDRATRPCGRFGALARLHPRR